MHTHFLGEDEVAAYLRDLAQRIQSMIPDKPTIWVPIGPSGRELVKELVARVPELETSAIAVPVEFDRDSGKVRSSKGDDRKIKGKRVLVLDSSIHSGNTFHAVVNAVASWGAKDICSYSLVLKKGSSFIPSFWGVTIGDHDRAYFLLPRLPNNHFLEDRPPHGQVRENYTPAKKQRSPYFHIRKLCKKDTNAKSVKSGTSSLDRANWHDRYYEMKNNSHLTTYVLETRCQIKGYVTVEISNGDLHIEAIAVDTRIQKSGFGAALLRWAETVARQSDCRRILMWGLDKVVPMYKKYGYKELADSPMMLDDGTYYRMMKPVLFHL